MHYLIAIILAAVGLCAHAQPIIVGQSAGFSGGQAQYSKDVRTGIEAAFAAANQQGGIRGRQIKLVSEDDLGKKENVVWNTKKLIQQHKVVALIGYTSGAGVEESISYINSTGVPIIAPATGNMGIRAKLHPTLFHVRAGYGDEMRKVVGHLQLTGVTRFAIAYLDDVGPANPQAMRAALAGHGLKPVAEAPLNRNATDFAPQVAALMAGNPQAVLFISNGRPLEQVMRGMRKAGYGGQFVSSSFAPAGQLAGDTAGLISIRVLPVATRADKLIVAQYQRDLRQFDPDAKPNSTRLEGYIGARVLIHAMQRAPAPTPAKIIAALESLDRLDLGGYEISFSPTSHDGSRFADPGVVDQSGALRF